MRHIKYILPAIFLTMVATAFISCDDMLDMGNENVLYEDDNTLSSANDTVNTFVGILSQLQKIGVRTNLFGELRGDLVTVSNTASSHLKEIADFNVSDDNPYNSPRDYYAVINNCNYFLAKADVNLSEKRYQNGQTQTYFVLRAEALAVRCIRAWIYLQLGQIYGENIPIVKEPILSFEDAESYLQTAPRMNLQQICQEFIDDLEPYTGWSHDYLYPYHGNPGRQGYSGSMPSRMSVMPIQLVLGDLYLWKASIEQNPDLAFQAAQYYYDYIIWTPNAQGNTINNTSYKKVNVTESNRNRWTFDQGNFDTNIPSTYYYGWFNTGRGSFGSYDAKGNYAGDVISAIAMDSVATEGHFNDLLYLYCLNELTQAPASILPSQPCINYSRNQVYGEIYMPTGATEPEFMELAVKAVPEAMRQVFYDGDIRLGSILTRTNYDNTEYQAIRKFANMGRSGNVFSISSTTRDVIIYRTGDVYLRLAEALNFAGQRYPACHKFAYYILSLGLDRYVMENLVKSLCNKSDSLALSYFKFDDNSIFRTQLSANTTENNPVLNPTDNGMPSWRVTQIGIHQRGSGHPFLNTKYYPKDADPNKAYIDPQTGETTYPKQPARYVPSAGKGEQLLKNLEKNNPELIDSLTNREHISKPVKDPEELPQDFYVRVEEYKNTMMNYSELYQKRWKVREKAWYVEQTRRLSPRQYVVVDSLLNIESALETCFEGFRFGYLMRDSYRHNDATILAKRVGERNAALQGKLSDKSNWFIRWKGLIGR